MALIDSVVLLKWLGLTLKGNESGNLNRGKLSIVLPAYISWIGRKSLLNVLMNVAVTLRLLAETTIDTELHPF